MPTLRRASPADAAELSRLRALMHEATGTPETSESLQAAQDAFARRLLEPNFVAFVVAQDERLLSSGAAWIEQHLPSPSAPDGRWGHIASMSTEPSARRQGHARAVFQALLAWLDEQGIRRVDLQATPEAQALYAAHGFQVRDGTAMSRRR